jgi:hypothetical protein
MSTPYMLTAGIARRALMSLSWFWAVVFVIGRLHALHEAYISISRTSGTSWSAARYSRSAKPERARRGLSLRRAQDPEFYSNIRQHTGICTEVQANARSSVLLRALDQVSPIRPLVLHSYHRRGRTIPNRQI